MTARRSALRLAAWLLFAPCMQPAAGGQTPLEEHPVKSFARTVYHHGIPFSAARSFGPEAVPPLVEMLESDGERAHWTNVVLILGMIGDPSATEPLTSFLEERFTGEVDAPAFLALTQVPRSLGFLARDPDSEAFRYLRRATSPGDWRERGQAWTYPSLTGDEREVLLMQATIGGLGVAGTPESLEELFSLREKIEKDSRLKESLLHDLDDAVSRIRRIQALGYERALSPPEEDGG